MTLLQILTFGTVKQTKTVKQEIQSETKIYGSDKKLYYYAKRKTKKCSTK